VAKTGTGMVVSQNLVYKKKKLISVRLTAEIKPSSAGTREPTGTVTFELVTKINKKTKVTTLGTGVVTRGQASMTLSASEVRQKAMTIVYSGDIDDKASTITTPALD
jgi:hypothetical protein